MIDRLRTFWYMNRARLAWDARCWRCLFDPFHR